MAPAPCAALGVARSLESMHQTPLRSPGHSVSRLVILGIVGILLLALGFQSATNVVIAVRNVLSRDDSSYPECAVVERALAVAKGESLYVDSSVWPYRAAVYGPLTYWPIGMGARLLGLPDGRLDQAGLIYGIGRGVSFASGLAILAWLFLMSGWMGLRRNWRFLPPLLFLSCHFILDFWDTYRPDFPMVALVLYAWAAALRGGRRRAALAAVLMALAIFHKQPAFVSAAGLEIWLLVSGRRRDAVWYGATLGGLVAASAAALWIGTGGAWWDNNFRALRSPLYLPGAWTFLFWFKDLDLLPFAGGVAGCLSLAPSIVAGSRAENAPFKAIQTGGDEMPETKEHVSASVPGAAKWAFALAFAGAELLIIRTGSNANYYLETYCWGAVLTGMLLHEASRRALRRTAHDHPDRPPLAFHPALILLLCLLSIPALGRIQDTAVRLSMQVRPLGNWERENYQLTRVLLKTKGDILMIEGYAWWFTQSPPTMLDPYLYSVRVAAGGLSSKELVGRIQRREFERIILHWDLAERTPDWQGIPTLPEDVVQAIARYYRLEGRSGRYYVHAAAPRM